MSIANRRHCQTPVGSGLLRATPAGLWAGRVASSLSRFHCRAPFWPPTRRLRPPWEASGRETKVTWAAGSGVVCRTHMRTYITGPTEDRSAVAATKAWLQYPARPSTRSDLLPLCATAVSTAAVPVPWQSGAVNRQAPDGAGPVWSSKSEQITAPPHSAPGGGVVVGGGVVGGGVVGGGVVGGGVVGDGVPPPPQDTPLRAKSLGAGSAVRQVPWSPNSAVPPVASAPFQPASAATTDVPVWVTVAFHADVTRWSPV